MKRIVILVIAATNQPLYIHYIKSHWTEIIRYTNSKTSHMDVFLLFERETDIEEFDSLKDNIIQDQTPDLGALCKPEYHVSGIPGILSKTVFALEQLQDDYDVFFRTNLSSVLKLSAFDRFVQNRDEIIYSGAGVWSNALRQDLLHCNNVGPDKSIKSLSELDQYEGDSFISGSGYFLNRQEVKSLLQRKNEIRFDIVDDVSIGLMFSHHELLPDFSVTISPDIALADMVPMMLKSDVPHIRLQHFPLQKARALWRELLRCEIWRS